MYYVLITYEEIGCGVKKGVAAVQFNEWVNPSNLMEAPLNQALKSYSRSELAVRVGYPATIAAVMTGHIKVTLEEFTKAQDNVANVWLEAIWAKDANPRWRFRAKCRDDQGQWQDVAVEIKEQ